MGMDLILGAVVLVAALRGWFRGFFAQAIRVGGLVGGVYLAGPLRDLARPIAADRLTSMDPGLLDRLLWWVAAAAAFVVLSGTGTGLLTAARKRAARDRELAKGSGPSAPGHRGDHSAGALFGAAKGAIAVAFLVAGIQQYTSEYVKEGGWMGEQVRTSRLLAASRDYEPARRIWESEPVRGFVQHVREMGLGAGQQAPDPGAETRAVVDEGVIDPEPESAQARRPSPRPAPLAVEPEPGGAVDLNAALEEVRRDLERLDAIRRLDPR